MSKDLDDEREILEVVEFSESEDEGFDYKEVEVRTCFGYVYTSIRISGIHSVVYNTRDCCLLGLCCADTWRLGQD